MTDETRQRIEQIKEAIGDWQKLCSESQSAKEPRVIPDKETIAGFRVVRRAAKKSK